MPTTRLQTGKFVLIEFLCSLKTLDTAKSNLRQRAHGMNYRIQFNSLDNIPMINQKHLGFGFCII